MSTQPRHPSSSEEQCKCPQCRNNLELKDKRSNFCGINAYKHLKKREGPPNKKEPASSQRRKLPLRKEGFGKNIENATPTKHKAMESKKDKPH